MTFDGLLLKDIVATEGFDSIKLWGDTPLLLIKSKEQEVAPFLFQTPDVPESVIETAEIMLGATALNTYIAPGAVVVPVVKTKRNPFDSIIVGRARNNDIRLDHETVSKVHAYLTPPKSGPWKVIDSNSTNGTWVLIGSGPVRIRPGESFRLDVGSEIRFGTVDCMWLDSTMLYAAVEYAVFAWRLRAADRVGKLSDTHTVPKLTEAELQRSLDH